MSQNTIFNSVEFMTAKDKEKALKSWARFLNALAIDNGETKRDRHGNEMPALFSKFTDRLYEHLSLHCGFIAHYDRFGFFSTYFTEGDDIATFIDRFESGARSSMTDYEDINGALLKVLAIAKPRLLGKANNDQREADLAQAKVLLDRWQ